MSEKDQAPNGCAMTVVALVIVAILGFACTRVAGNNEPPAAPATPTPAPIAAPVVPVVPEAVQTPAPVETPPPPPAKKVYKAISAREFAKVCKNPDAYVGRAFIIWGEVTQFDAATGASAFRASIGATKKPIQYGMTGYTQNCVMSSDEAVLKDIVAGDCFGARVMVLGSLSYDTQIGGTATVPQFLVDAISRYGSTK